MEGNKNFGFGGDEDYKKEIRNLKLARGYTDLASSGAAEEAFAKSIESARDKNKEILESELENMKLHLSQIEKDLENTQNDALDIFAKIKNLRAESASITAYSPGYDTLGERINAATGEFEKISAKAETLIEKKRIIGEKIKSFEKQVENQRQIIEKSDNGGLN